MTMSSPFTITLTVLDESVLRARARSSTAPHRDVIRARIVLAAAEGAANAAIAAELGVHVDTVRKWRRRFCQPPVWPVWTTCRAAGGRAGSPPCRSPRSRRWPARCPPRPVRRCRGGRAPSWPPRRSAAGSPQSISASTVRRWLAADAIKPWQHRSWIFPRDPDFAAKAARVLDLYARTLGRRTTGRRRLRDQRRREVPAAGPAAAATAASRPHPGAPDAVEFEYRRGGTLAYLAAYDVHRAQVIGQFAPTTGIDPFDRAGRPGHDHRALRLGPAGVLGRRQRLLPHGARSVERMHTAWPTATLVHLPVHASWLNQVEIYFSILQRKAITPNDFADLDHLAATHPRLRGPLQRHRRHRSTGPTPADDLNAFLRRLDLHDIPHAA